MRTELDGYTAEYGYNADGVRVWKRDLLNQQEYRYVCRIGCGGVPMRVYNRAIGGTSWNTLGEYVDTPTAVWYGPGAESFSDYPMAAGHWLSNLLPPAAGQMLYLDAFGPRIGNELSTVSVPKRVPEYLELNPEMPSSYLTAALPIIPIVWGAACGCAIACLAFLIGCVISCISSGHAFGFCVTACLHRLPPWLQLVCGVCAGACLVCLQFALCPPWRHFQCLTQCQLAGFPGGFCLFGACICIPPHNPAPGLVVGTVNTY